MAYRTQSPAAINRTITQFCISTSVGIYVGWNYAEQGLVYQTAKDSLTQLQTRGIAPKTWQLPDPNKLWKSLDTKCIHKTGQKEENYESWLLSNFSHKTLIHLAFNLLALRSFSPILEALLPTRHYAVLLLGSGLAANAMFAYEHKDKPAQGLGASGIVSGVAMACTLFIPTARASLFGIVPAPLFVLTGAFFALDTYMMQSGTQTGIGHGAHLGGGIFGAVYYALFLRRFKGGLRF